MKKQYSNKSMKKKVSQRDKYYDRKTNREEKDNRTLRIRWNDSPKRRVLYKETCSKTERQTDKQSEVTHNAPKKQDRKSDRQRTKKGPRGLAGYTWLFVGEADGPAGGCTQHWAEMQPKKRQRKALKGLTAKKQQSVKIDFLLFVIKLRFDFPSVSVT